MVKLKKVGHPQNPLEPIRVAVYVRVSSEGQDIANSVDRQLSQCRTYAAANNMAVVATYIDEAISGRTDARPRFQEMYSDTAGKEKPFEAVLVWKFARFARNRIHSALYKNRFKRRGVRVISASEYTDDSSAGRFMENVIEDVDQFYSDNLSEEVRSGQRKLAERGYYPGNRAPYGYRLKKVLDDNSESKGKAYHNIFVIEPSEAAVVRRIFRETIAGRSRQDIRRGLKEDSIPTALPKNSGEARSKQWPINTIGKIQHNLHYAGFIVWGVNSKSGDPPIIAPGLHEPIVSKEDFFQAERVMASNAPTIVHPKRTSSVYMMSGMLWCRLCGKKFVVRPSKCQTSRYYQCQTRRHDGVEVCDCPNLNIRDFEERFLEALFDDILCPSNLKCVIASMNRELALPYEEKYAWLASIEKELEAVYERQARIMTAYEGGAYTVDDYSKRMAPLRQEEADLRQRIEGTDKNLEHQAMVLTNPEAIMEFASHVSRAAAKHTTVAERKCTTGVMPEGADLGVGVATGTVVGGPWEDYGPACSGAEDSVAFCRLPLRR